ncbi:MAG: glycosyltransferase [Oscillatoriales cyanobacterium RM1_1_9]|nr:glycosyltransferase [Oscillatoriales cyanobacterium SM2_3_0]NJO45677.1 glycosyltransferase [Oscillatoriales cyanobacterium RM2_1_1]NJO70529.1 glycosyltransferase [Oscillatoriales cyanobacterium RM1_1_9]
MRIIVYSHDAFGLGNIRRMLAICQHLLATIPDLSILVLSGSPAIHSFRIPDRLDYIKLPCFGRDQNGQLGARYLASGVSDTIRLRSNLIKTAVVDFQPDLVMVDKKPYGLLDELKPALDYLRFRSPMTKLVLLLRDILDDPTATIEDWKQQGYYQAIQTYYDQVLVVGMPEIFDLAQEYQFPNVIAQKTKFCGYIRKTFQPSCPVSLRQQLGVGETEKLVLVTPGGGGDGYCLVDTYLSALEKKSLHQAIKSLIVFGIEMPESEKQILAQKARQYPGVKTLDFTDDLMSYINASDLVVAMAGYNTITEILSLHKRAVVVPRCKPSREQSIRAERMGQKGWFQSISLSDLTIDRLSQSIMHELSQTNQLDLSDLNLNGLETIHSQVQLMIEHRRLTAYLTA